MIISVDVVIAAAIAIAGTIFVAKRQSRLVRGQTRLSREMRDLTRRNAELAVLIGGLGGAREIDAVPPDIDELIEAIIREVEAGPYVRTHIRPDLPPEVGAIHLTTPDGPITITSSRRRERYREAAALPLLGALWRGLTSAGQVTTAAALAIGPMPPVTVPAVAADRPPAATSQPDAHARPMIPPIGPMPSVPGPAEEDVAADATARPEPVASIPPIRPTSITPQPTLLPTSTPSPTPSPVPTSPTPSPTPPEATVPLETLEPTPRPSAIQGLSRRLRGIGRG